MRSSPWKLLDKKFQAAQVIGGNTNFLLENCGTSLPDDPADKQIFTLVDSLTVPTYAWTFRYNKVSISYRWEFVGGLGITVFAVDTDTPLDKLTSTKFRNSLDHAVYYKPGTSFALPYGGEYEFTGGVVVRSDEEAQVSTQIVYWNRAIKLGVPWSYSIKRGFNHVPLPLKRLSGLQVGKISLGIGSMTPSKIKVGWSACAIRPVKVQ